jgi:hypothetical protein
MESVDLPKGLIRYASEENIEKKAKFEFTPRLKGYTAVLTILTGLLVGLLMIRSDIEAKVLRLPGQTYEMKDNGKISNVFTYKLLNKTNVEMDSIHFILKDFKGEIKMVKKEYFSIEKGGIAKGTFFIETDPAALKDDKNKIEIEVYSKDRLIDRTTTNFMGPRTFR